MKEILSKKEQVTKSLEEEMSNICTRMNSIEPWQVWRIFEMLKNASKIKSLGREKLLNELEKDELEKMFNSMKKEIESTSAWHIWKIGKVIKNKSEMKRIKSIHNRHNEQEKDSEKDNIKPEEEKGEEPTEENKDSKPPVEQEAEENLNAEDKILLEELRAKSSDATKNMDLQYFIDKAGENPVAFAETFGEEILNKLITRIPTSKLEKNYLNLKQLPGTKISSMALKNFIEERKDKNENLEAGKDDLIQTLIKEFDGEYLKINGLKSKLYDTNKTEEELEKIKNEIFALTEGQKQRIESLVKNGASEDILRDRMETIEGVNRELKMIDEEKNKGQNELKKKKNELFKQFMESIKERKELEKRLAEIDKMLEEINTQPKETTLENSSNNPAVETKNNEGKKEQKIITMDDFKWYYGPNYIDRLGTLNIDGTKIQVREVSVEEVKRSMLGRLINGSSTKTVKLDKPYCEIEIKRPDKEKEVSKTENIETALIEINELMKKNIEKLEDELMKDREQKQFLYFAVEKSNNRLIIDRCKNEITGLVDLRFCDKDWTNLQRKFLAKTGDNEGFFEFNIYGFVKIIKNVNELTTATGISAYSDQAIYKIVGPNEKIVAENIKGYDEATRIYNEATEKYKKQVEEEFNKIKKAQ